MRISSRSRLKPAAIRTAPRLAGSRRGLPRGTRSDRARGAAMPPAQSRPSRQSCARSVWPGSRARRGSRSAHRRAEWSGRAWSGTPSARTSAPGAPTRAGVSGRRQRERCSHCRADRDKHERNFAHPYPRARMLAVTALTYAWPAVNQSMIIERALAGRQDLLREAGPARRPSHARQAAIRIKKPT
jgi:hypothetical protein